MLSLNLTCFNVYVNIMSNHPKAVITDITWRIECGLSRKSIAIVEETKRGFT